MTSESQKKCGASTLAGYDRLLGYDRQVRAGHRVLRGRGGKVDEVSNDACSSMLSPLGHRFSQVTVGVVRKRGGPASSGFTRARSEVDLPLSRGSLKLIQYSLGAFFAIRFRRKHIDGKPIDTFPPAPVVLLSYSPGAEQEGVYLG